MRIGTVAAQVGVNPKTIRYYESIGLLPEPARTPSGYRDYVTDDVERLRFVRRAAQLDLQLDEIGEILALRDSGETPCAFVVESATKRLSDLDERITQMRQARDELERLLARARRRVAQGSGGYCDLIEHQPESLS